MKRKGNNKKSSISKSKRSKFSISRDKLYIGNKNTNLGRN